MVLYALNIYDDAHANYKDIADNNYMHHRVHKKAAVAQ